MALTRASTDVALSRGAKPATERRLRRSYEAGHRPKLLVVVDEAPDCDKAVYYGARRAAIVDLMRLEAQELLRRYIQRAQDVADVSAQTLVREGAPAQQILKVIQDDEEIAILVLAAGSTEIGPGALVSDLARTAGTYPVPVVIVPAHLSEAEIDALS